MGGARALQTILRGMSKITSTGLSFSYYLFFCSSSFDGRNKKIEENTRVVVVGEEVNVFII